MTLSTEEYRAFCALFRRAERVLKRVEAANPQFSIPGAIELRNAGNRLAKALSVENEEEARQQVVSGENHLRKCIYESLTVGISRYIQRIDAFQREYNRKLVAIPEVIRDYPEKITRAKQIQSNIGALSEDEFCQEENLRATEIDFDFLEELSHLLDTSSNDLTAIAKRRFSNTLIAVTAIIVGIAIPVIILIRSS